jgi:hypothetical protein
MHTTTPFCCGTPRIVFSILIPLTAHNVFKPFVFKLVIVSTMAFHFASLQEMLLVINPTHLCVSAPTALWQSPALTSLLCPKYPFSSLGLSGFTALSSHLGSPANTFNWHTAFWQHLAGSPASSQQPHTLLQLNQCIANSHVQFCKPCTTPWQQATFWKVAVAAPLTGLLQHSTTP